MEDLLILYYMKNEVKVIKKFDYSDKIKVWLKNGIVYKKVKLTKPQLVQQELHL